jgi:hypothetical protein
MLSVAAGIGTVYMRLDALRGGIDSFPDIDQLGQTSVLARRTAEWIARQITEAFPCTRSTMCR